MAFPKSLARFYFEVFLQRRASVLLYYFVQIVYKVVNYILPAFLAKVVVSALEAHSITELTMVDLWPMFTIVAIWLGTYVGSDIGGAWIWSWMYPRLKKIAHVKIFTYLIDRSVAFYKNHSAGYLAEQAKYIVNNTWKLLLRYPIEFVAAAISVVINITMLFGMHWIFSVMMIVAFGFRVLHSVLRFRELAASYTAYAEQASIIGGKNVDLLSNFLNLKIFGNSRSEEKYIGDYFEDWVVAKERSLRLETRFFALPVTLEYFTLFLMIVIMSHFYINGIMNLSQIAFVLSSFFAVHACVAHLVWMVPDFMDDWYSANNAFHKLTRISPAICNVRTGTRTCSYNSQIAFNNVSFKYDEDWVLRDITLCIKKGEKVGIVGTSGSGKTTLVNLLMHLYDVTSGSVEIDGVDIRQFNAASVKKVVSFVPQESILFNRTLADNISYGVPGATRRQIIRAAKQAQAHDFIMAMENGYDTIVGDRGVKLSGGQRQRITIAHAILKNSPILLLDEATSALDSETEAHIQASLNRLMQGRTTIAIAHRLATLQQMDRIIVMDRGRIVEQGTPRTLLKKRGLYYRLWQRQHSGFM